MNKKQITTHVFANHRKSVFIPKCFFFFIPLKSCYIPFNRSNDPCESVLWSHRPSLAPSRTTLKLCERRPAMAWGPHLFRWSAATSSPTLTAMTTIGAATSPHGPSISAWTASWSHTSGKAMERGLLYPVPFTLKDSTDMKLCSNFVFLYLVQLLLD